MVKLKSSYRVVVYVRIYVHVHVYTFTYMTHKYDTCMTHLAVRFPKGDSMANSAVSNGSDYVVHREGEVLQGHLDHKKHSPRRTLQ